MFTQILQDFRQRTVSFVKELPSLLHLSLFILAVLIGVVSFNFEVFRVLRVGDIFLMFFAFLIGVHWYGQRMAESGYKNGVKAASESQKPAKRK